MRVAIGTGRSPGPVEEVIRRETGRCVENAIAQLPERQQNALRLVCFQGHSYRSAAAKLGVTEKAIKSALNRAKHNLKSRLHQNNGLDSEGGFGKSDVIG